jgi:dTDP-4-dehydrorhamnose 3,5-epimerase
MASTVVSAKRRTLTGLHFRESPHWETKLARCTTGATFVVATDLREDSPTRLRWGGVELSDQNRRVLHVPEGFAQGYQTLAGRNRALLPNVARMRAGRSPGRALGRSGARDQMAAARRGTQHLGSRPDLALLQSS